MAATIHGTLPLDPGGLLRIAGHTPGGQPGRICFPVNGIIMKIAKKRHPLMLTVLAVLAGIVAYLSGIPFLDVMELKTIDLRFESRGTIAPHPDVVLAVIDEKSIVREGKWIWPRAKIAELVNRLSGYGAKVIAFDIGFLEPDENTGGRIIEQIVAEINKTGGQNQAIQTYLNKLKNETDNDRRLADAIQNSGVKVVLGYFFQMDRHGAGQLPAEEHHSKTLKAPGINLFGSSPTKPAR